MVCLEREARESERSLLHRRLVVVSAFLSLLSLRSPSTPLAATMTTTSSSSGLTYKLHPVSAADGQEKREGKSERHRDPIGLPTPRSFAHPRKKKHHDRKQLVVVNISDHVTRAKVISSSGGSSSSKSSASADAEAADATARVAGCLLGSVGGATRTVDVANSFELVVPVAGARPDAALLRRRLDQCTLLERERERERREKKEREEDPTFLFFDPTLSHPSRDPPPPPKKRFFRRQADLPGARPRRLVRSRSSLAAPRRRRDHRGGGPRRPVPRGGVRGRGAVRPRL